MLKRIAALWGILLFALICSGLLLSVSANFAAKPLMAARTSIESEINTASYPNNGGQMAISAGSGQFIDSGQNFNGYTSDAAQGDLDNDGDIDLFLANDQQAVWLNDGSGQFIHNGQVLSVERMRSVDLGDVDQDGDLDAFIARSLTYDSNCSCWVDGGNQVWLNDGSGLFFNSNQVLGNSFSYAVDLGDLDGDGDLDAYVGNKHTGNNIWLNDGLGQFSDSGQILGDEDTFDVVIADIDNDGDLDGIDVNFSGYGAPNHVWKNDGYGHFALSQTLGISKSTGIALGDLDQDGDLDAFILNSSESDRVWLNNGQGEFSDSGQSLGGSRGSAVSLGDFDADGDLDAFIVYWNTSGGTPSRVLLNDGTGIFTDSGQLLGDSSSSALALGDFDGDDDLDAFVGNSGSDIIWLNLSRTNVELSLNTVNQIEAGKMLTYTVVITNFGPDPVVNMVMQDSLPSQIRYLSGTVAGTSCEHDAGVVSCGLPRLNADEAVTVVLETAVDISAVGLITNTAELLADIIDNNPDDNRDTAVTQVLFIPITGLSVSNISPTGLTHETAFAASTLTGNGVTYDWSFGDNSVGQGQFPTHTYSAIGVYTAIVTASNPVNSVTASTQVTIANNFWVSQTMPVNAAISVPSDTEIALDFNMPVDPDNFSQGAFHLYDSQAAIVSGSFVFDSNKVTMLPDFPLPSGRQYVAVASKEIVSMEDVHLEPYIWQFQTDVVGGSAQFITSSLGLTRTRDAVLGDLDGDEDLDVFLLAGVANTIWINDGTGFYTDTGQLFGDHTSKGVALGDIDSDGDLDAFVVNIGPNLVWLNDGTGQFTDSAQALSNQYSQAVALGDLDGDGDLDAMVGNAHIWANTVWFNDGNGNFVDSGQLLGNGSTKAITFSDFDGDGDLDAITANDQPNLANKLWINDGAGLFTEGQSMGNSRSFDVASGDINGDGAIDIIFANIFGDNHIYLNNGSGVLSKTAQVLTDRFSYSIDLGDLDGDGDLDAFLANHYSFFDNVYPRYNRVYLNDGQGVFSNTGQEIGIANSISVDLGDVDGDGDLDALVGNSSVMVSTVWLNQNLSDMAIELHQQAHEQTITYTVPYTNQGPSIAQNILITSSLPTNLVDIAIEQSGKTLTQIGTAPHVWETALLNPGEGGVITITGIISDYRVANHNVTITSAELDDNWLNNAAEAAFNVADLAISKKQQLQATNIAYTIVFTNYGPDPAYNVTITDVMPTDVLNPVVTTSGVPMIPIPNTTYRWQVPYMDISETGIITITGVVSSYETVTNRASIATTLFDPNPENDHATVSMNELYVLATTPPGNGRLFTPTEPISAAFSREIEPSTLHSSTFLVRGNQTGFYEGNHTAAGTQAAFAPDAPFKPGEVIVAQLSSGVHTLQGNVPLRPYAWQFRAPVDSGSGHFADGGQVLSSGESSVILLGDLNGNGALDAVIVNLFGGHQIWFNDGYGTWSDSGQKLGDATSYGAALGDLDGDADLDLFIANNNRHGNTVWFNDGTGHFVDSGQLLGNSWSYGVDLGDLDGDGDLDAIVANGNREGNEIWLNDGNGIFIDTGQRLGKVTSQNVNIGDLDGDGDLDAFFANPYWRPNRIWFNDGNGNFVASEQSFGLDDSKDSALGDLDGDGDLDVVVANGDDPNRIWLNDGKGIFSFGDSYLGSAYSSGLDIGDVDADGDLDVLVSNFDPELSLLWLNDGHGVFTNEDQMLGSRANQNVTLGDLDGDGDLDAVTSEYISVSTWFNQDFRIEKWGPETALAGELITYTLGISNVSAITFTNVVVTDALPTGATYVSGGVLDGDDVVHWNIPELGSGQDAIVQFTVTGTTPLMNSEYGVTAVSANNARGHVAVTTRIDTPIEGLTVANNSPTPLDHATLFTATISNGTNVAYEWAFGDGVIGFGPTVTHRYPDVGVYTATVTATNLEGSINTTTVVTIEQLIVENTTPVNGNLSTSPVSVITATFNMPIDPNSLSTNAVSIWGDQTGYYTTTVNLDPSGYGIVIENNIPFMPGETIHTTLSPTIVAVDNRFALRPHTWQFTEPVGHGLGYGNGVFAESDQNLEGYRGLVVALGDLDQDGDLDFISGEFGENHVFMNNGYGRFTDSNQKLGNEISSGVALGDLDGDGDLDAFITHRNADYEVPDRIWLNDGNGVFTDSGQRLDGISSDKVVLGDLDGDGDLDAVVGIRSYDEPNKIWFNDGTGHMVDSNQPMGNSITQDLALGDLDGDNDLDIFEANGGSTTQPNHVWLNDGMGQFTMTGQEIGTTYEISVALGDIDGDGDLDAAVGNHANLLEQKTIWLNDGNGFFYDAGQSLDHDVTSYGLDFGDLDGDGDLDLFAAINFNNIKNSNHIWINDGMGNFQKSSQELGDMKSRYVALGDLDNDGDLDAVVANDNYYQSPNSVAIWLNQEEEITGAAFTHDAPTVLSDTTMFTATVGSGTKVHYEWDFGDGHVGQGEQVSHLYDMPGVYTAVLTAQNGLSTITATATITVDEPINTVIIESTADDTVPVGEATIFTATVLAGSNVTYRWDFGSTNILTGQVVSYTYTTPGTYTPSVTASNSVASVTKQFIVVVEKSTIKVLLPIVLKPQSP